MNRDIQQLLYILDLFGVAVFAVSGALAAGRKRLDLLGVLIIAVVTAIGGGTIRDVLLDRHPVFWITDPTYLLVIISATIGTILYVHFKRLPDKALLIADAMGLAVFTITGAQAAQTMTSNGMIIVMMAATTGTAGGLIRDVLTAKIPMILQRDIYASACLAGATAFLLLQPLLSTSIAVVAGMLVVMALRMAAIQWNLHLPHLNIK